MFLQQISGKRPFKSRKDRKLQNCLPFRCTPKKHQMALLISLFVLTYINIIDILMIILMIYRIGLEPKWHATSQKPHHESYWLEQTRILSPKESKPSNLQNAQMTRWLTQKKHQNQQSHNELLSQQFKKMRIKMRTHGNLRVPRAPPKNKALLRDY